MANFFNSSKVKEGTQREIFESKYNSSIMNILLVVVFSFVNVVLLAVNSNTYFLFSAFIPAFRALSMTVFIILLQLSILMPSSCSHSIIPSSLYFSLPPLTFVLKPFITPMTLSLLISFKIFSVLLFNDAPSS